MSEDNKPRRRGRPRETSREQMTAAAIELLTTQGAGALTINGLARFMGMAPMGFYNYFADLNELRQSVADRVLANLNPDIQASDSWQTQLTTWANAVRSYFLEHPYLMPLLGWDNHVATSWLRQVASLTRIIALAGYRDEALTRAVIWSSKVLIGAISMELAEQQTGNAIDTRDFSTLPPEDVDLLAQMMPHIAESTPDREFQYCIAQCITALLNPSS